MILFRVEAIFASNISKFRKSFPQTDGFLTRPKNQPSPLRWSITLLPMENQNKEWLGFFLNRISTLNTIVDQGISRIAIPIFAVFAVRPLNSAEFPPVLTNSQSTTFLQISALELSAFCLSSLAQRVSDPATWGTDPRSLCGAPKWINSLSMISGESNVECWLPKTFSCDPDVFHVTSGKCLPRLSEEENSLKCCRLTGNVRQSCTAIYSTSWNSPELKSELLNCLMIFFFFCTENSSTRSSRAFFSFNQFHTSEVNFLP